jgi:hypothetical protein
MFIFGEPLNITDDLYYTHQEIIASQKIMTYWTNFAKYRYFYFSTDDYPSVLMMINEQAFKK